MTSVSNRCVTPAIDFLRTIVRGKAMKMNALRFANQIAARTQPQPDVPGGPFNKTTKIYYYTRDGRREVKAPINLYSEKQLESGNKTETMKRLTPGKVYQPC